jgi:hypothetical protein
VEIPGHQRAVVELAVPLLLVLAIQNTLAVPVVREQLMIMAAVGVALGAILATEGQGGFQQQTQLRDLVVPGVVVTMDTPDQQLPRLVVMVVAHYFMALVLTAPQEPHLQLCRFALVVLVQL